MRVRYAVAAICLLGGPELARAQFGNPYQPFGSPQTAPFAPNSYNRQFQPLSPYLNMFRGSSPAVNYYYGVRPGTQAGGYTGPYGNPAASAPGRQTFFPYTDTLAELEPSDPRAGMPPTGHPAGFNNTLGYLGGPQGMAGGMRRGQTGMQQQPVGGAGRGAPRR
jgi:hypothetical protein